MFVVSKGGLTVPNEKFLDDGQKFEADFLNFHKDEMDRGEYVIDRFTSLLVKKYGQIYKKDLLYLFAKTRTFIRFRYLCNLLKAKQSEKQSKGTRDYKQTAQHSK